MSDEQDLPNVDPDPRGGATPTGTDPVPDAAPAYAPVETQAPDRPRPGRLAALWIGLAALLAASLFAVVNLTSSEGPSSPEAAVNKLFEAASNEDIVGALEALPPSERDVMKDDLLGILGELSRLDILAKDFDPASISGVDLEVTDLELSTDELGDGVTTVHVTGGKTSSSVTPSELPLGKFVKDFMDEDLPSKPEKETTVIGEDGEEPFDLVTIKEGGSWYVSIWYTAAEAARQDSGKAVPKFGDGIKAAGESSPEEAVRALIEAGSRLDLRAVIALLPPDEARALHDYAPLFVDDVEEGAEGIRQEYKVVLETLETSAKTDGDVATVSIDKLALSVDGPDMQLRFSSDGKCTTIETDGEEQKFCTEDMQEQLGIPNIAGVFGGGGIGVSKLVTVKRDGEWFVSPIRSILKPIHDGLREVDESELDELREFIEGMMNGGLFGMGMEGSTSFSEVGEPIEADDGADGPDGGPIDNGSAGCSPIASDGTISGYSQEEFSQLSPEEQNKALEEAFATCEQ